MRRPIFFFLAILLGAFGTGVEARFVSPDPAPADTTLGTNFNRYYYANNNPYRFVDPDGQVAIVTHNRDGSKVVEFPTTFVGPAATPQNVAAAKEHVAAMSGTYMVDGKETSVTVRVVDVESKGIGGTPRRARNEVTLVDGETSGPSGRSFAETGGKRAEIDVTDRFVESGVTAHEFGHLGGVSDAYDKTTGMPDPSKGDGIMNRVPGTVDSPTIEGIINARTNIKREER